MSISNGSFKTKKQIKKNEKTNSLPYWNCALLE